MKTRRLGASDLFLSEIGYGTWPLGGPNIYQGHSVGWRPIPEEDGLRLLESLPDLGITFLDTADIYGKGYAETLIGKALTRMADRGRSMVVATKVGFVLDRDLPIGRNKDYSRQHLEKACEASLKRLGREVIDLYQLHNVPLDVIRNGEVFESLDQLRKAGKIREYGVSIVTTEEALTALEAPGIRSIQIIFNMFRQKPAEVLFQKAKEKGVGILARVPLASGLLAGRYRSGQEFPEGDHRREGIPGETFSGIRLDRGLAAVEELRSLEISGVRSLAQAALQFAIGPEAVTSAIPGSLSLAQLRENAAAPLTRELSQREQELAKDVYTRHFASQMERLY